MTCARQLPGIATNLLADRLRELEEAGLVDREELPPPVARTVYTLSETGWRKVLPVVKAIATFGLDMIEPDGKRADAVERVPRRHPAGLRARHRRRPERVLPHRHRRPPLRIRRATQAA